MTRQVTVGGRVFRLPYLDAIRPLTGQEYQSLKDDIFARGRITVPLLVDQDDNIIDGNHRITIAAELSLPLSAVPVKTIHVASAQEARDLCESVNACRRHLTREEQENRRQERARRVLQKHQEGKSTREIAREEGVVQSTVSKDLAKATVSTDSLESVETVEAEKASDLEDRIRVLRKEGKSYRQIVDELGVTRKRVETVLAQAEQAGQSAEPSNGKVIGVDGKKRSARRKRPNQDVFDEMRKKLAESEAGTATQPARRKPIYDVIRKIQSATNKYRRYEELKELFDVLDRLAETHRSSGGGRDTADSL